MRKTIFVAAFAVALLCGLVCNSEPVEGKFLDQNPGMDGDFVENAMAEYRKRLQPLEKLLEETLADPKITDEQYIAAAREKMVVLVTLANGDSTVLEVLKDIPVTAEKAGRAKIAPRLRSLVDGFEFWFALHDSEDRPGKTLAVAERLTTALEAKDAADIAPEDRMFVSFLIEPVWGMQVLGLPKTLEFAKRFQVIFKDKRGKEWDAMHRALSRTVRRGELLGTELKIAGKLLDGRAYDPAAEKGKIVVVYFCDSLFGMKRLSAAYYPKDVQVVAIFLDEQHQRQAIKKQVAIKQIAWPCMMDADTAVGGMKMSEYCGQPADHEVILVGRDGKIVCYTTGEILPLMLERMLGEKQEQQPGT